MRGQKEPLEFDEVHTRGVLAGAYAGRERTLLTHLVYRREGVDVRVGCRQPLYNIVDEYADTEEELRSRPTCPTCARKWDKLQLQPNEGAGFHGSSRTIPLTGRYWVALDREYAQAYGDVVREVPIPDNILDLTGLGIYPSRDEVLGALQDAGVDTEDITIRAHVQTHQHFERGPDELEWAIEAAGYSGVMIREETESVGETTSVLVFDADTG